MQAADLNLALEQINGLYGQGLRLIELSERVSKGLTMDLALEADQLLPSLKASELYFSASKAQNQLAMEGIVESIVEGLRKLFKKVVDTIKRFLNWITGSGWATNEENIKRYDERLAKELAEHPGVDEQLASGKCDEAIIKAFTEHPSNFPVLKGLLYDHPGRSVMLLDQDGEYHKLVDQGMEYLREMRPRMQTTAKILEEVRQHIVQMEVAKIPDTLEALRKLWVALEGREDIAKNLVLALHEQPGKSPHQNGPVKTGVKYSYLYRLHEKRKDQAKEAKLAGLIVEVGHPLELLSKELNMFDQALEKMKKAGDAMAAVPGMQRADGGNPEDFRKSSQALHEIAMLVLKVAANEFKLIQTLTKHGEASLKMSHAWFLGWVEALRVTQSEETLQDMQRILDGGKKAGPKK